MRKDKLIELLQKIPGNPDILLWNGFVGDWQDVDSEIIEAQLVRRTLADYLERCRIENCNDRKDRKYQLPADVVKELTKRHKDVCRWEENRWVTQEDIRAKRYTAKRVFMIQSKLRNVSTFDRNGTIEY